MATIRTAIQMHDGMSPVIKSMTNALNIVISSFETLQNTSSHAVDTRSLQAAREELNRVEIAFNEIEQDIREADQAQQEFNNDMRNGEGAADGLLNKIKNMAVAVGAAFSVNKIIDLADGITLTRARLDLMNYGLDTTAQLQEKIFASAQRARAAYQTTANAVAQLGSQARDAFKSNDELIAFTEQVNKTFVIAGTSAMGAESTLYNLTQALSTGVLRGQDLNAVLSNAQPIVQNIADYLDVPVGKIKEMAAEGQITADIVKNAMLAAADETNAKFNSMPMTFGQVATIMGNTLLQTFDPIIQGIGRGAQFIYDNWSTLEPIFWGLATAVGVYAITLGIKTAATWLAVAANRALIITMLSNPLLWIAVLIGVVVGAIYKWVKSVGGIKIAWQIAANTILTAWDWIQIRFMKGCNSVQTFVGNMKVEVLTQLQNMVNGAIDIINNFINKVNKIPGVSIDTIAKVSFATTAAIKNKAAISARDANITAMEADARTATAQRLSAIKAAQAEAKNKQLDNIFNGVDDTAGNTAKMANAMEVSEEDLKYLRDLAEREVIDRTVLRDVKVSLNNTFGDIRETADIDGIINKIEERLAYAIANEAEGSFSV